MTKKKIITVIVIGLSFTLAFITLFSSRPTTQPIQAPHPVHIDQSKVLSSQMVFVKTNLIHSTTPAQNIKPLWWWSYYYLQNIQDQGLTLGDPPNGTPNWCREFYNGTPYPLYIGQTISATGTFSNDFTSNTGVSGQVVSAGVSFNTSASYSFTDTVKVSFTLKPGETRAVAIYPYFEQYYFQVWWNPWFGNPYQAGYGYAWNYEPSATFDEITYAGSCASLC